MASLLLFACGGATIPASRRADGGWHLNCGASLEQCVRKSEELCKGRGYVVVSGMSKRTLYGAELGVSQVAVRESELDIACADRRGDLPQVEPATPPPIALPRRAEEPVPAVSTPALAPAKTACTPGATQRCIGSAACSGGQSCVADGSGFGPCDCGHASPP